MYYQMPAFYARKLVVKFLIILFNISALSVMGTTILQLTLAERMFNTQYS